MMYLSISGTGYYSKEFVTKLSQVLSKIVKEQLSVKLLLFKDLEYIPCMGERNIQQFEPLKKLLISIGSLNILYYIELFSHSDCNGTVKYTQDILSEIEDENIKSIYNGGICKASKKFDSKIILDLNKNESVTQDCICGNDSFSRELKLTSDLDDFETLHKIYKTNKIYKISENLDNDDLKDSSMEWYQDVAFKLERNLDNEFEISETLYDDLIRLNVENLNEILGTIVRSVIAPSRKYTSAGHELLIESHPNQSKNNEPKLKIGGITYDIYRSYVLGLGQVHDGSNLKRIIYTTIGKKSIFLNYIENHEISDNQIEKSIKRHICS